MPRFDPILTADDIIRAGACVEGVYRALNRVFPLPAAAMPLSCILPLLRDKEEQGYVLKAAEADGYGYGYGYGCGYGYGSGDGYGYGYGYGGGYGGDGSGYGGDGGGYGGDGSGYGGDGSGFGLDENAGGVISCPSSTRS